MAANRLTDKQRAQIGARYLAGATQAEIARSVGCSASSVTKAIAAAGLSAADRVQGPARGPGAASPAAEERPDFRAEYAALGAMGGDALNQVEWVGKAIAVAARHAVLDPDYRGREADRRHELVVLARALGAITPQSLLAEVRRLIKGDAEKLTAPKGAEREDAPAVDRRTYRASTSRGRPREF